MRHRDELLMRFRFHPARTLALVVAAAFLASASPRAGARGPGGSGPPVPDSTDTTLLVESFETVKKDHDVEAFRTRVDARYPEESLTRILESSPDVRARRAAALAAGLSASFRTSNAAVAKGLKDRDAAVRNLTENV